MPPVTPMTPDVTRLLAAAGLCGRCRHAQVLRSKRSTFLRCALADQDPRFARYPGLPVLQCAGFKTTTAGQP